MVDNAHCDYLALAQAVAEQACQLRATLGSVRMEASRERQKAIRAALAENRRSTRALEKAEEKRKERLWKFTPWLRNVVLILYFLTSHAKEPVVKYLATVARRRKWPPLGDEEIGRAVEDLYLEVDMDELMALSDRETSTDAKAMKEASRVYEEWRLAMWVERLNLQRGLAPPTALVLERYEANRSQAPEAARPPYRGVPAEAAARMWARRWRLWWGGRHGSIPARDEVPLEEKRHKVATFVSESVRACTPFQKKSLDFSKKSYGGAVRVSGPDSGPQNGTGFRDQFWGRNYNPIKNK